MNTIDRAIPSGAWSGHGMTHNHVARDRDNVTRGEDACDHSETEEAIRAVEVWEWEGGANNIAPTRIQSRALMLGAEGERKV